MAKRMKFSVVGLPHYTIWHLYEPSVDDIKHMEDMEKERKEKEAKEKAEKERMQKIKDQFQNPQAQWEKDKSEIRDSAKREYVETEKAKAAAEDKPEEKVAEIKVKGPGELKVESKAGKARI